MMLRRPIGHGVPLGVSQGQHADRQPPDGEQGEEGEASQFDEAPGQRLEVIDEAEAQENVLDIPPEGTAHIVEGFRQAEEEKRGGGRDAENEGHHLILTHGREEHADRQERPGREDASNVPRQHHAPVWIAEAPDLINDRPGQKQRKAEEAPSGQKLAKIRPFQADREGQEELNRSTLSLLCPESHRHGRHEDHKNPWHEGEEGVEVGLTDLQKPPEVARHRQVAACEQEDDDEDVAER